MWLIDDSKMSKSTGNVINPIELIDYYGEDSLRFFLMRERNLLLGQDSSFSFELFKRRYNDDLANDLGNLLNRITILIGKFCNHSVPLIKDSDEIDNKLISSIKKLPKKALDEIKELKIHASIEHVMTLVRSINKYLEVKEPWKSLKGDSENQNGLNALSISCEAITLSAKLLYPVMPKKCEEIFNILEIKKESLNNLDFETISGNSINPHKALFPRIENDD